MTRVFGNTGQRLTRSADGGHLPDVATLDAWRLQVDLVLVERLCDEAREHWWTTSRSELGGLTAAAALPQQHSAVRLLAARTCAGA
ncbi:MAG: hypothetical protein R2737_09415 [Candidatus Nanopelagicales bacterium]